MDLLRSRLSRRVAIRRSLDHSEVKIDAVKRFWYGLSPEARQETLRFEDAALVRHMHDHMKGLCRAEMWCMFNAVANGDGEPERLRGFHFEAPRETNCIGQREGPTAFLAQEELATSDSLFEELERQLGSKLLEGRPVLLRGDWATVAQTVPSTWQDLQRTALCLVELAIFQAHMDAEEGTRPGAEAQKATSAEAAAAAAAEAAAAVLLADAEAEGKLSSSAAPKRRQRKKLNKAAVSQAAAAPQTAGTVPVEEASLPASEGDEVLRESVECADAVEASATMDAAAEADKDAADLDATPEAVAEESLLEADSTRDDLAEVRTTEDGGGATPIGDELRLGDEALGYAQPQTPASPRPPLAGEVTWSAWLQSGLRDSRGPTEWRWVTFKPRFSDPDTDGQRTPLPVQTINTGVRAFVKNTFLDVVEPTSEESPSSPYSAQRWAHPGRKSAYF